MKLTKETKAYLKEYALKKRCKRQQENLRYFTLLIDFVHPARVYHVEDIDINGRPTLYGFAKSHGCSYPRLLRLLRKEGVLRKMSDTWVWSPQYKDMDLAFYTVGYWNKYGSLDMHLLPEGVKFLEDFVAAHPVRERVERSE